LLTGWLRLAATLLPRSGKLLAWYGGKDYREISRQVLDEYRAQSVASDGAASSTNLERSAHVPLGVESRIA
jgi:hypothetical protein